MRKTLAAAFAALILGIGLVWTQPTGAWIAQVPTVAAGYTGPGDVVASARGWWGLRCYNTAYTGNVAELWDGATGSTTQTILTCSAGGTINATVNSIATTCAVSCRVRQLYDQSGANSCVGGIPCPLVSSTNANRPVYTQNCIGSLPCMTFAGGSVVLSASGNYTSTAAQPVTVSSVSQVTNAAAQTAIYGDSGTLTSVYTTAPGWGIYAGSSTVSTAGASINTWYARQDIYNAASSVIYENGTSNSPGNPGTNPSGNAPATQIGNNFAGQPFIGKITEVGIWPIGFSAGQQSSMDGNQRAYWGF